MYQYVFFPPIKIMQKNLKIHQSHDWYGEKEFFYLFDGEEKRHGYTEIMMQGHETCS